MSRSDRAGAYLVAAWVLSIVAIGTLLLSLYFYRESFGTDASTRHADWGEFGDFVGGFAGTVIAAATLIALALTLRLQAKELKETREQLKSQAATARYQVTLSAEIERRKIRPIIKAEWFNEARVAMRGNRLGDRIELRMTNVGLGAGIIDRIEIFLDGERTGEMVRDEKPARELWRAAIDAALAEFPPVPRELSFQPLSDLTRALAPTERQWIVRVEFKSAVGDQALPLLLTRIEPVIHFRSLAAEQLTTRTQLVFPPLPEAPDS